MTIARFAAIQLAIVLTLQRMAHACPFCGGKGASGLPETLVLVAALWLGARAVLRAMKRRRLRERPPEPDAAGHPSS